MWNSILKLFGMDKESIQKREGKEKYRQSVLRALEDLHLDENEKRHLEEIVKNHDLSQADIFESQRLAFQHAFDLATSDDRLSDSELASLNEIVGYFGCTPESLGVDQSKLNRTRMLAELEQGRIPVLASNSTGVILKEDEKLHYVTGSVLVKRKRQVERVNYSGPSVSIRIVKGVRYRIGSVKPQIISREVFAQEDSGVFYVTNSRIGFKGGRKAIEVPLSKITAYEVSEGILNLYKSGRESPYLLYFSDYDVVMSLLSNVLEAEVA